MNYKKLLFILGCGLALSLGKVNAQSSQTFSYTGVTTTWTVPCGVTQITITSNGAQGGTGGANAGGKGATITGTFSVTSGAILNILVGGQGGSGSNHGGGGGGSFVCTSSNAAMCIAGGGGGAYYSGSNYDAATMMPGSISNNGSSGIDGSAAAIGGAGGTAGGGGGCAPQYSYDEGQGGAGLTGNGTDNQSFDMNTPTTPQSFVNGGAGGASCYTAYAGNGGFGGGGAGDWCAWTGGGGGGGYSGGGGGTYYGCGGGGGSYNGGSAPTNTAGVNAGNGSITITWVLPATLVASASVTTNETCNGGNNGSASSTVSGGSVPYTYAWTGGGTNSTVSGLTAGSYTLTVNDACGNSASASVTITQPNAIVATISSTNVACNGGDTGSASSTVTGGTGAYTYSWTGGGTNATITGLTAGTYNLNVQDANGCTGSATVTITQPNILMVSDSVTANVLCSGDSTGSASSTVTGGTMPYMYLWTGGGTTDTAVGWMAGSYTLTVQDANGCTGSAMVTITQPTAITIVKHTTPDNGSSNGTASVNVSGGVSPYTYAWTGGNTTDSISGKAAGVYCCTVTDANGCMANVCDTIRILGGIDGILSIEGQIMVYPNPNNGEFIIQSSLNAVSVVEVYNVLGEKVFAGNLNSGNNTINMTSQLNGVYLYRVMSESGTLLSEGKISVQK